MRAARRLRTSTAAVACFAVLIGSVALAVDPATLCKATKMTVAGAYDLCLLKAYAKALKTGGTPDAKCKTKFTASWTKAEAKSNGTCPTSGDATSIGNQVEADVAAIIAALMPSTTTSTTVATSTTTTTFPSGPPCGGATYPGCGGTCAAGSSCWSTTSAGPTTSCTCLPAVSTPCADTAGSAAAGPSCGGACPSGEVCSTLYVDEATLNTTCGCITAGSTACLTFGTPGGSACGGACPSGMSCGVDPHGLFACACQ
jgi:hypothetical protein